MSRPWFPFYVGDYVRDTARLTTEAHGAYLLLMLDYWVNGAPPDDDETLATITKLPVTIWRKRRPMLVKFFKVKDGVWTHSRIEKERAKAEEVGMANSDKARAAAELRWAKERERKLQEQSEQCPGDAPSIDGALPQNAQSQPPSPSNPYSKNESALSSLDSRAEKDRPTLIDEAYQPSDAAIEYAYSLKMKAADLKSELSKFIAHCMGLRIASYNPDANFKKWCDQWLDYQRKHEKPKGPEAPSIEPVPLSVADWRSTVKRYKANRSQWSRHAGPEPGMAGCRCPVQVLIDEKIDPASGLDMTPAWHFIDHTTNEAMAFMHDAQARKVRAPAIYKFEQDGIEKTGFFSQIAIPPGYDEATGERIAPAENEDAA
jgi:uncharacterized protein YdaU (DUF1376 family)